MKTNKIIVLGFCDSDDCSPVAGKYVLRTRLGGTICPVCKANLFMQRQAKSKDNHYKVLVDAPKTREVARNG